MPTLTEIEEHSELDPVAVGRSGATGRMVDLTAALLLIFVLGWYWLPATIEQGSSPHDNLFYFGVLPVVLLTAVRIRWRRLFTNPVVAASLVFVGYFAVSAFWSREPVEFGPPRALLYGLSTAAFLVAVIVSIRPNRRGVFRFAVVIAATSAATVALIRLFQGHGYPVDRLGSAVHFEHPNLFAHYLGFAAVLATGAALRSDRLWARWAWLGSVMVLTSAVLLTRSRTATAALLVCLLASAALYLGQRAAALLALAVMVSGVMMSASIDGQFNAFVLRGDAGRDFIYRSLVQRLGDGWGFGAGIAADDEVHFEELSPDHPRGFTAHHPHSAFVGAFYYGGALGIALLLTVLALAAAAGLTTGRRTGEWDPLLLLGFGTTCLLVDGERLVSNPHLSSWMLLWLPVGLIASSTAWVDQRNLRGEGHRRTPQDFKSGAPSPGLVAAFVTAVVALELILSPSPHPVENLESWFLIAVSTAGLVLLLAAEVGTAVAGIAGLVFVSTPIFAVPSPFPNPDLVGLAAALIGAGLWVQAIDQRSAFARWSGGVAMSTACLLSPAVVLSLAPAVWWWTRSKGARVFTLAPIAVFWIVGWALAPSIGEPLAKGGLLNWSLLSLELWLSEASLATVWIIGLAGAVPAVVGTLLATTPEHRWLLWWFVGAGAGVFLLIDPTNPGGRELIVLAAPAAAAVALGILWLGRELVQLDLRPGVEAPTDLDEGRGRIARLLVVGMLLIMVATRLWSVGAGRRPDQPPTVNPVHSSMVED